MLITARSFRLRIVASFCLLLYLSIVAFAQDQPLRINYRLAMTHPNSHLFEVSIRIETPPEAKIDSIDFQMPKWSPGRYAVFDFAKNVQEVRAESLCPPSLE